MRRKDLATNKLSPFYFDGEWIPIIRIKISKKMSVYQFGSGSGSKSFKAKTVEDAKRQFRKYLKRVYKL